MSAVLELWSHDSHDSLNKVPKGESFYRSGFCNSFNTENVLVQIIGAVMESWSGVAMCTAPA